MKKISLIVSFLLWLTDHSAAQQYYNQSQEFLKANSVWTFSENAGISFNSGPTPFLSQVPNRDGVASVASESTGRLLFYSNGVTCWDSTHTAMPNGTDLLGNGDGSGGWTFTQQGACIVPVIGSKSKYYLFSLGTRLYYSIVDMNLNGGKGDIVSGQKNIQLDSFLSGAMIAIPGNNCDRDAWLMVHTLDSAVFKAYHITAAGINPNPVLSATGSQISGSKMTLIAGWLQVRTTAYTDAHMVVSPDRKMLAIASSGRGNMYDTLNGPLLNGQLLCKFDPNTGIVSDAVRLSKLYSYGAAFSPDNSKLYTATSDRVNTVVNPASCYPSTPPFGINTATICYQYNVTNYDSTAIMGSRYQVFSSCSIAGMMRLYNDTIYYVQTGGANGLLNRINNPNLTGAACNFQYGAITLAPGSNCYISLPNEVVTWRKPDTFYTAWDTTICTSAWSVTLGPAQPVTSDHIWNDGSTVSSRQVTANGTYWLQYRDSLCNFHADTFKIGGTGDLVGFSLGPDTTLCKMGIVYELESNVTAERYRWQDGRTVDRKFTVTEEGTYWLELSKEGCIATDTVHVRYLEFKQDLGPDTSFCRDAPVQYLLTANAPAGAGILWNTGATSPQIVATAPGNYTVAVSMPPCTWSDEVSVDNKKMCFCKFIVPNAFSPNGDGRNDDFGLEIEAGCPVEEYSLHIFNRWGQRVFQSYRASDRWKGTFGGVQADAGVYFYELRFTEGTDKQKHQFKGDITLLR